MTSIGILFGALLFGGLRQGAGLMQLQAGIPGDLVFIIQALVLFSIAAEFLPVIRRNMPRWLLFSRKPALVGASGLTVVDLPQEENGKKDSVPPGESMGLDAGDSANSPKEG